MGNCTFEEIKTSFDQERKKREKLEMEVKWSQNRLKEQLM